MPFFSIIIPTFNAAATLATALESVLSQTFTDFEVLIMDGCSTDNTLDIAQSYNDERVKIFRGKDKGVYDAMNKGIEKGDGEWLYFLGSDDKLYNNDVLKSLTLTIESCTEKIVYGNVLINGVTGWANHGDIYDGEFTMQKLLQKNICHQAVFYKKIVFKKCGQFNLKYKVCADHDFNLKAGAKFKMHYSNKIICEFSAGGLSSNKMDYDLNGDFYVNAISYFTPFLYRKDIRKAFFSLILNRIRHRSGYLVQRFFKSIIFK